MVFITVNAFILVDVEPESRPWAGILLAVSVGRAAQAEPTAAALCSGEIAALTGRIGKVVMLPIVDGWSCVQAVSGYLSFTRFPCLWTMGYDVPSSLRLPGHQELEMIEG